MLLGGGSQSNCGELRKLQVSEQIGRIETACECCTEELRGLEERLKTVLQPFCPPPTCPEEELKKPQAIVLLAAQLLEINLKIDSFINVVRSIKQRLEI